SSDVGTPGGGVHLALAFNPSHLEIVCPVVEGSVRARQMRRGDRSGIEVVPVLIHGDAAFAGQGVVMETFNMSQSRGFSTMGTVHLVINNQVGFTTSVQRDARSTLYCTDVAKMVNAPIIHVKRYEQALETGKCVAPHMVPPEKLSYEYATDWTPFVNGTTTGPVDTRVALEVIRELGNKMLSLPEGFELNPQVAKVMDNRRKMIAGALPLDWGCAELLAYATLLKDGTPVRMSGQDVGRGTFTHRHAIVHNYKDGNRYVPLRGLFDGQPDFRIINSLLSEE